MAVSIEWHDTPTTNYCTVRCRYFHRRMPDHGSNSHEISAASPTKPSQEFLRGIHELCKHAIGEANRPVRSRENRSIVQRFVSQYSSSERDERVIDGDDL